MSDTSERTQRWVEWITHHGPLVLIGLITWWYFTSTEKVSDWVALPVSILIIATYYVIIWCHERSLCSRCLRLPRDLKRAVERIRWATHCHHRVWLDLTILVLVFARPFMSDTVSGVAVLCAIVLVGVKERANLTHRRFILWCPRCRGHGGGGDSVVLDPTPPPVPAGVKVH
ncbi:MAG: hypothetical protein ACREQ5_00305 [Candidatus Dormibacteria bacterium]